MSEFKIEPLADAVQKLRSDINNALAEFDQATGGAVSIDVVITTCEVTTVSDQVRRYRHQADVPSVSIKALYL